MAEYLIELPPDTVLARVFFRLPSQKQAFDRLLPVDFVRRRDKSANIFKES